jgi:energy-coupling factor transporter transmembrane protein EcfT
MAEINLFHYFPQDSLLHRMDPRLKIVGVVLLSVTVGLAGSQADLWSVSVFLGAAVFLARLSLWVLLREMRYFAFLVIAAVIIQAVGRPGPLLFAWLPGFTRAGLTAGLLFAWRLLAMVVVGLVLTGTTQLTELKTAIYWWLQPLPGRMAVRLATMFSLTLALIPLIFDQAAAVREAQISRGIEQVKNPWRRLSCLVWPVLRETFRRADELILAMESRCYSEERSQPVFSGTSFDVGLLGALLVVAGLVVWF